MRAQEKILVSGMHRTMTLQGLRTPRLIRGAWICSFAGRMLARKGVATYAVVSEAAPSGPERRGATRRAAYLQSGKILDCADRFLTEFTIRNRTENGMRLTLAQRVSLPRSVLLFDDRHGALLVADIVWQHGGDAGCRISRKSHLLDEKLLTRLKNRYYAVE